MPRKSADEVCTITKTVRTTQSVKDELARLVNTARVCGDDIDRGHDGKHEMTECYLIHCILEEILGTRINGALQWIADWGNNDGEVENT